MPLHASVYQCLSDHPVLSYRPLDPCTETKCALFFRLLTDAWIEYRWRLDSSTFLWHHRVASAHLIRQRSLQLPPPPNGTAAGTASETASETVATVWDADSTRDDGENEAASATAATVSETASTPCVCCCNTGIRKKIPRIVYKMPPRRHSRSQMYSQW